MYENSNTFLINTVRFDPGAGRNTMLPYALIDDTLKESTIFNNDTSPEQGQYLLGEFEDFASAMQDMSGFEGVFGTGHPFYALDTDKSVTDIPEIGRFIEATRVKVIQDSWRYAGNWACSGCQVETDLPDLKQFCKPCRVVDLKPRDVFKALPDLDFWVVVDSNSEEIEEDIRCRSQNAGFYQSDISIHRSIESTNRVLKAVNNGQKTNDRLPIDLHIVEKKELLKAIDQLECLDPNEQKAFIPIQPRSLHVTWERADQPYNFALDFLLSMTDLKFSPELQNKIIGARHKVAEKFTNGQLIDMIFDTDPKSARQLADPAMMRILANRLNNWRQR